MSRSELIIELERQKEISRSLEMEAVRQKEIALRNEQLAEEEFKKAKLEVRRGLEYRMLLIQHMDSCNLDTSELSKEKLDCDIIKQCIKHEIFENQFSVCSHNLYELIINDTEEYFNSCTFDNYCNRAISYTSRPVEKNDIWIYRLDRNKENIKVYFMRRSDNDNAIFDVTKKEDGSYKVSIAGYGTF